MQLLEQLVYETTSSNDLFESVFIECANIQGYMECINELCESEILLEGVNVKETIKRIGNFILGLFKRIKELGSKAIVFLKRKATELAAKFKRKNGNKSGTKKGSNQEYQSGADEEPIIQVVRTKDERNELGKEDPIEKTRDEKIADILSQNPFTGPHPNGIIMGLENFYNFVNHTLRYEVSDAIEADLKDFDSIIQGNEEMTDNDKKYFDKTYNDEFRFRKLFKLDSSWREIRSILNGPNDIPKAMRKLYSQFILNEGYYFKDKVFEDIDDIVLITISLRDAENRVSNIIKEVTLCVESTINYCDKASTGLNARIKELESRSDDVSISIQSYMNQMMKDFAMLTNISTMVLSEIPNLVNIAMSDIKIIQDYVTLIDTKLNSLT